MSAPGGRVGQPPSLGRAGGALALVSLVVLLGGWWLARQARDAGAAPADERLRELESVVRGGRASREELAELVDLLTGPAKNRADEERLRLALGAAEQLADGDREALVCMQLGYIRNGQGRLPEGLELFERAEKRAVSPATGVYARCALVDPLLQVGRIGRVQQVIAEAASLFERIERPERLTELRFRQAELRAYLGLGLLDRYHAPLQRLEELVAEETAAGGNRVWELILAVGKLDWFNRTGRYETALALEAGIDPVLLGEVGYARYRSLIHLRLGISAWMLGRDDEAMERCVAVIENPGSAETDRMQCETRLAEIHLRSGRAEEAARWLREARTRASRTATAGAPPEEFEDELFLVAIEHRAGLCGLPELERAFSAYLEAWSSAEARPGGLGVTEAVRQRMFLVELMAARMEATPGEPGRLAALEALFRVQELGSLARSLRDSAAGAAPTLAEVRARFTDQDSGLLVYFLERTESLVFALNGAEIRCARLGPERALVERQQELSAWMVSPPPRALGGYTRPARELAEALLPDEIRALLGRWTEVAVQGLGHLGTLPFELLQVEGLRAEERWTVTHLPSLPAAGSLARSPDPRERDWSVDLLLVAAPAFEAESAAGELAKLPALPIDAARAGRLAGGLARERVREKCGREATVEALARGEIDGARVLHVIAHGQLDETRERQAVLVLRDQGGAPALLGCSEVEELSVPPIVILSACRASLGHARAGDDRVSDLSGAFLRAGAQVVLLAPHEIDYDDACALGGMLIELLRRGETPAAALRKARAAFLDELEIADPARAFLQAVGLGNRPVFARKAR